MILPENKRRNIEQVHKRKLWIYGAPFSGKTTFANSFPDPLMLNTDGNVENVDAPYIPIRDNVKVEGRMTKRTLAWEVFKDTISELEKKQNTFKTIVVDLNLAGFICISRWVLPMNLMILSGRGIRCAVST